MHAQISFEVEVPDNILHACMASVVTDQQTVILGQSLIAQKIFDTDLPHAYLHESDKHHEAA